MGQCLDLIWSLDFFPLLDEFEARKNHLQRSDFHSRCYLSLRTLWFIVIPRQTALSDSIWVICCDQIRSVFLILTEELAAICRHFWNTSAASPTSSSDARLKCFPVACNACTCKIQPAKFRSWLAVQVIWSPCIRHLYVVVQLNHQFPIAVAKNLENIVRCNPSIHE